MGYHLNFRCQPVIVGIGRHLNSCRIAVAMKRFICSLIALFTLSQVVAATAQADEQIFVEGQLIKTYLPNELPGLSGQVCLTLIDQQGQLVAVAEDVYYCHYARSLRAWVGKRVVIDSPTLDTAEDRELAAAVERHFPSARIIVLETE